MQWLSSPYCWMGLLNISTGMFSAGVGLKKVISKETPAPGAGITGNPWLYVTGGIFTILLGVGNWQHLLVATVATVIMMLCSLWNGWFGYHGVYGAAPKYPVPIVTLNAYVLVLSGLLIWTAFAPV
ncbi:hypothetical protein GC163_21880 [bacterium]|nr:hypothetical protein [bacterium]